MLLVYALATLGGGTVSPLVYRRIIDTISAASDRAAVADSLMGSFGLLVGVIIFYQGMYRLGDFLIISAQSKTIEHLNNRAFESFMRQGYSFFTDRFTGSLVAQARRYVRAFEDLCDIVVFNFWMPAVSLTGTIVALFLIKPVIAVVFLLWIPVYILVALWITRKSLPYDKESAAQDSVVTGTFSDALTNILTVKTFASAEREREHFSVIAEKDERTRIRAWRFRNILIAALTLMFATLEIAVMYVVIRLWIAGEVSAGTVVLVQVYTGLLFFELFSLGRAFGRFVKNAADATEMIEIMERHDAETIVNPNGSRLSGAAVSFDDVTFRYEKGSPVFQDFSLDISSGEKVGLVGVSGSGKSTLTKLLLRFVLPQGGTIRIGGRDIMGLGEEDLRETIAYVPQDTALFHRSIAENIGYGRPKSSREKIMEAAKKAHADEFIASLPQGYDTLVGERGVKLSGGQRQRIAIARAILKNAPILVLDEATSSLDSESEHAIQASLDDLMRGKTALVIAHRLSTVRKLDRIVVLDRDGRTEEEGTHDALIARNGLYARLWSRQTGGFIDE